MIVSPLEQDAPEGFLDLGVRTADRLACSGADGLKYSSSPYLRKYVYACGDGNPAYQVRWPP